MIIEKYGIRLKRLTINDIEMVREKRNSPSISSTMEYQKYITREEQERWFYSINNINNFYFLIEYGNETIGLLNDKNIYWDKRTSEAGLFIWNTKYYNTLIPGLSSLILLELGYELLKWNKTKVKVLNTNFQVISYIKTIGFIEERFDRESQSNYYWIDRIKYLTKTRNVILSMTKIHEDKTLKILVNKDDILEETNFLLEKIASNSGIFLPRKIENGHESYFFSISQQAD